MSEQPNQPEPSNGPLVDIIPAAWRKYVYAGYALVGVVLGALRVAGVDVGAVDDVYQYLGIALGVVAAANTRILGKA